MYLVKFALMHQLAGRLTGNLFCSSVRSFALKAALLNHIKPCKPLASMFSIRTKREFWVASGLQ